MTTCRKCGLRTSGTRICKQCSLEEQYGKPSDWKIDENGDPVWVGDGGEDSG